MSDNNQLLDRDRLADARSTLQKRRSRLSSRRTAAIRTYGSICFCAILPRSS